MSDTSRRSGATTAARVERRWGAISVAIIALLVFTAAFAGIHQAVMPQTRVETADPRTLHIAGEFIESNLGSAIEPDGSVTVRAIGQQYSFTPQCIVLPTDTPIIFRATSADVVHGFLIENSTVNTMLIPGYISTVKARFSTPSERYMPCHEFCGAGHEGMWGKIKVIDRAAFLKLATGQRRLTCVAQ
ncbi:MAG: cytochrome C oxidase subunit II [Pseudomonadota bacterium]|nr:cytochrome C oxidase subunit II [Pseudomonadota bacterium]